MLEKIARPEQIRRWDGDLPVRHRYTPGVAGDAFFAALKERGVLLGSRCESCAYTYVPARLFCERGFEGASMGDLSDALGLTKAGVYHHIRSKESLLLEIQHYGMDVFEEKVLAEVDDPLATVPAFALCGGVALYLLSHDAIRYRSVRSVNPRRLLAAAASAALIPVATRVDGVVSLAFVAGVCVALIAYETLRFREARARLRTAA